MNEAPPVTQAPGELRGAAQAVVRILRGVVFGIFLLLLAAGLILPALSGSGRVPRATEVILAGGQSRGLAVCQLPADARTLDLVVRRRESSHSLPHDPAPGRGTVRFSRADEVVAVVRIRGDRHFSKHIWVGGTGSPNMEAGALVRGTNYLVQVELDAPLPTDCELRLELQHKGRDTLPSSWVVPLSGRTASD
jgi:hypothetical protein